MKRVFEWHEYKGRFYSFTAEISGFETIENGDYLNPTWRDGTWTITIQSEVVVFEEDDNTWDVVPDGMRIEIEQTLDKTNFQL